MAIKEVLTLEGDDVVIRKLQSVAKAGEDSLKSFRELSKGGAGGAAVFDDLSKGAADSEKSVNRLREAFHVLNPILKTAGVSLGEFTSFSRVLGTGITGISAAIGGAFAVSLANLQEEAAKAQAQLTGLFNSSNLGKQAFDAIDAAAKSTGVSFKDLAPAFQAATTALQRFQATQSQFKAVAPPGQDLPAVFAGNIQQTLDAVKSLSLIFRSFGQDGDQAAKSAAAFFKAMQEGGKLTADILKTLDPGAVTKIAEALGKGSLSAEAFIAQVSKGQIDVPINKLIESLAKFQEGAQKAFDATGVRSMSDALGELRSKLDDAAKSGTGFKFNELIVKGIDEVSNQIQLGKDSINSLIDGIKRLDQAHLALPGMDQVNAALAKAAQLAQAAVDAFKPQSRQGVDEAGFEAFASTLTQASTTAKNQVDDIWRQTIIDGNAMQQNVSTFQSSFADPLVQAAQNAWNQIQQIFSQQIPTPTFSGPLGTFTGGGFGEFFAGGGQARGPGSTTSDSIMAFLSNREWVINAKAVDFYGSSLFSALNSMRLPRSLLTGAPRMAEGGQVRQGASSLTLVLGGRTFATTTSDETLTSLRRFAVHSQLASIGRKPGFVR